MELLITLKAANLKDLVEQLDAAVKGLNGAVQETPKEEPKAPAKKASKKAAAPVEDLEEIEDEDFSLPGDDDEESSDMDDLDEEKDVPELTISDVKKAYTDYLNQQAKKLGSREKALTKTQGILKKLGVKKVAELKEKDFAKAMNAISA